MWTETVLDENRTSDKWQLMLTSVGNGTTSKLVAILRLWYDSEMSFQ